MNIAREDTIHNLNKIVDHLLICQYVELSNIMLDRKFRPIDMKKMSISFNNMMGIFRNYLDFMKDKYRDFNGKSLSEAFEKIKPNIKSYKIDAPSSFKTFNYNNYDTHFSYLQNSISDITKEGDIYIRTNDSDNENYDFFQYVQNHRAADTIMKVINSNDNKFSDYYLTTEIVDKYVLNFVRSYSQEVDRYFDDYYMYINKCMSELYYSLSGLVNNYNKKYMECGIDSSGFITNSKYVTATIYTVYSVIKCYLISVVDRLYDSGKYIDYLKEKVYQLYTDKEITESVYTQGVEADTADVASRLINGDASPFIEYSQKVYDYHANIFVNKYDLPESNDVNFGSFESVISKFDYDKDIYVDVMTVYQKIMDSLVVLAKNSDDYLMIFDDMIEKSGLSLSLEDRFSNTLELIDHLKEYPEPIPGSQNLDLYYRIMNDIKNYPSNMENIAGIIRDVYTQSQDLKKRFERRINGEFKNAQAVVELQNYMTTFEEQFQYVVNITASKLMARLKKLAYLSEAHLDNNKSNDKPVGFIESTTEDFLGDVYTNEEEIARLMSEATVSAISKEYYKINAFNKYGIHIMFEAEGDNNASGGEQEAQKDSTKVTVNDNSGDTVNTNTGNTQSGGLKNIIEALEKWFDELLNRYDTLCERQKSKNTKWLADNKEVLRTRRYVNISASILPYEENMSSKTIINELSSAASNINAISGKMNTLNTEQDIVKAMFPNIKVDDLTKFSDVCTNYFKVGNNSVNVKEYENRNLGELVNNTVIPFCENYYDSYTNSVKDNVKKIKNAVSNLSDKYVKESVVYSVNGNIYLEADEGTADEKNTSNVNKKMEWVRKYTKLYTGSALNAIRDRNNDYFKLMSALIPKRKPTYSEKED